jgi:rod shape-determining protein MreC
VLIEQTRARAVLAGDNSEQPKLIFLSANTDLQIGQRIVTSGHGGAFPPGIPVGVITALGEQGMRVTPYANEDRLEYLRLMDFGLNGILPVRTLVLDVNKTGRASP